MNFVRKDNGVFMLHLFAGLVCVFYIQNLCSFMLDSGVVSFELKSTRK